MVLCIEHSECYLSKSIILIGWIRDMLLYYMYKASRCQTNCYINQVKALNFTSMMFLYTFILCFIIFIRYTLLNIITLLSVEFNFFFWKMPLPTFLCYGILILILTEHIRLWQILPNIWINDLYWSERRTMNYPSDLSVICECYKETTTNRTGYSHWLRLLLWIKAPSMFFVALVIH